MATSFSQRAKQLRRKSFLSFEKLEDRTVMAGNVTAIDASGYLLLFGDGGDNQVAITQNLNGSLNVAGTAGTTINGQASATLGAATRGALILMGEGNDNLSITGTAASALNIGSSTTIDLGGGNDTLNLTNFGTAGSLTINAGAGNDTVNLARALNATTGSGAQIGGNLVVQGSTGDDSVTIRNSSVRFVTVVDENVGNDTADIRNSQFGHVALFIGNVGIDSINNAGNTFAFNPYVLLYENVTAINAPVAVNDTATATIGQATTINVLGNDNANGGTLNTGSVVLVQAPVNGTAIVNPNGTISYTPTVGTTATTDVFTYTVADTNGNISNAGTVNVSINSPPTIAGILAQTTPEDTAITVPISVSDVQTTLANLIITGVATAGTPGLITSIVPNATNTGLIITPAPDASGTATITVTATDAAGASTTQTFTLDVTPVDDLPTISPVANVGAAIGTSPTVNVTVDDVETPDANVLLTATTSNPLVTATVTSGANGARTVTINNPTNVTGPITVNLIADDLTDIAGTNGTGSFVVNFSAPPVINLSGTGVTGGAAITGEGATVNLNEDATANVNLAVTPPDVGETVSVAFTSSDPLLISDAALQAGFNLGAGTLAITPTANAHGTATITAVATDSAGLSTTRTFTINVASVDDLTQNLLQTTSLTTSVSGAGSVSGDITSPVTVGANGSAAADVDGPLTVTGIKTTSGGTVTAVPTGATGANLFGGLGTLTMRADGTYTFTADPSILSLIPTGLTTPVTFYVDLFDGTTTTEGQLTINLTRGAV
jgi:VCBS repeat-containing protein